MTNAELLTKIKAEIDKKYAEYREKMKTDDFTYYEGMADALDLFEQFIDTLESEKPVPKDLEEAAEKHASMHPLCNGKPAKNSFIAGAKWDREQMMKGAVETELYWDGDFLAIDLNMAALGYSEHDKVRVIVCKKED